MKNVILILFFYFTIFPVFAENLPKCSDLSFKHMCYGKKLGKKFDYIGQFKNNMLHGKGKLRHKGDVKWIYRGQFKNDFRHGYGEIKYKNGYRYVGEWKNGKINGQGTYYFSNGDKYIGEYENGKRNGVGTYYSSNGEKYVGEWKNGRRSGQGTYYFSNGDKYVGEWKNGKRNGKGNLIRTDKVNNTPLKLKKNNASKPKCPRHVINLCWMQVRTGNMKPDICYTCNWK